MKEHALFLRGLLDPAGDRLISVSDTFAWEDGELLEKAGAANDAASFQKRNRSGQRRKPPGSVLLPGGFASVVQHTTFWGLPSR